MTARSIHSLVCLGEFGAVLQVQSAVLGRRKQYPLWVSWALALLFWGITQWFWGDYVAFSLSSILFNSGRYCFTTFLFGGRPYKKMNALLLSGVTILFYENVLGALTSALYGIPMEEVWRVPYAAHLYLVVLNGLVFVVLRFLRRYTHTISPSQKAIGTLYLCIIGLLNLILMQFGSYSKAYSYMFLISVGLVLSSTLCFAGFVMLSSQIQRASNADRQALIEQQRADALMDSYQTQRRLTHEFKNHLGVLRYYLEKEDLAGAKSYIANLSEDMSALDLVVNTRNPLLDALLSREYYAARQAGVLLNFNLCDLSGLSLSSTELVTLVCNLLDNAIDAAQKADPPQVDFRARPHPDGFLLSVRNRVTEDIPLTEDMLPVSTKSEPGHGIGLHNVQQVVRNRGGEFFLSCKDRWFCFTCILPKQVLHDPLKK